MAKISLNKSEMEHVRHRVNEICKCTSGEIATIINRLKKGTRLTDKKKFAFICDGVATVVDQNDLVKNTTDYNKLTYYDVLLKCFNYPETTKQKECREFNERIERKKDELIQEVHLEGKRLIDNIVLGIVTLEQVPDELHKLGSMTSIARTLKRKDFEGMK